MEYVDGEDLRTIIDHASPLPAHTASLIALGIARGLEYTHSQGIIHRDIKPSNILISRQGDVKLIDFGIAKDDVSAKLTLTGMIVGTPAYMAPEQANGDPLSVQSDLFSLGILLYEMLTGVKPFLGENNTEILARIVRNKYVSPERINPGIPVALRRIVKKILRKDPLRRYQNSTELIYDLEKVIPWQLRSRKKQIIARMLSHLNKDRPISATTIDMNVYTGPQTWAWKLFRYSLSAVILFCLIFLGSQFSDNHLGHIKLTLPEKDYLVQIDNRVGQRAAEQEMVIGPLLKGTHSLLVQDEAGENISYASLFITPSDTVRMKIAAHTSTLPSTINIKSDPPGALVKMNGDTVGFTPVNQFFALPGKVTIELSKEGKKTFTDTLHIRAGKQYDMNFKLSKADADRF